MENRKDIRKSILNEPSYWIEKLNIDLYDALITYQEKNKLKKGELAEYLEISNGRLSQILNDGDSNFNTATLVNILLKLGKYPQIDFVDQEVYFSKQEVAQPKATKIIQLNYTNQFTKAHLKPGRPKVRKISREYHSVNKVDHHRNYTYM